MLYWVEFTTEKLNPTFVIIPRICHECRYIVFLEKAQCQLFAQSMSSDGFSLNHYRFFCQECRPLEN